MKVSPSCLLLPLCLLAEVMLLDSKNHFSSLIFFFQIPLNSISIFANLCTSFLLAKKNVYCKLYMDTISISQHDQSLLWFLIQCYSQCENLYLSQTPSQVSIDFLHFNTPTHTYTSSWKILRPSNNFLLNCIYIFKTCQFAWQSTLSYALVINN